MSCNNPLVSDNVSDTLSNLSEYVDFVCVAASNDEDVPAGLALSLRLMRSTIEALEKMESEKKGK